MKIHKGDTVKIISGNDKGKQGKVLAVFPKEEKIVVEGANIKKKHMRPRSQGKKGELVRIPAPLRVSRVMLWCPKCGKVARTSYELDNVGSKSRLCKRCGGVI
jgi:large subunit ribosomal protein L24